MSRHGIVDAVIETKIRAITERTYDSSPKLKEIYGEIHGDEDLLSYEWMLARLYFDLE